MRSTTRRLVLLAATFVFLSPAAALADVSAGWFVPGGGVVWPPNEFGTENPTPTFGAILGFRLSPPWAIEVRGHYANPDSEEAYGAKTRLTHFEGNATWFLSPEGALSPYLTAGLGAVRIHRAGDTNGKFAWNAGAGVRVRMSDHVSLRFDGRDVSYEVPNESGESSYRHAPEIFGGVSLGFGGEPPDEDRDTVTDKVDKCPGTPAGARVDAAGCPLDSDADGVADGIDQCEGTPKGCTVNPNGCPSDADQDGVCDGLDKCPDTQANVRVDITGCPIQVSVKETEMIETGMIRLQDINFETGKAVIKSESFRTLDDVGNILVRWPQLRVEIGGHTDSKGSEALNQKLSEARAKAVLDYLTNKYPELTAAQFTTVGYGERQPIASNKTALGMAKNRRVEFKVLNKEALKKQIEKQQFVPKE